MIYAATRFNEESGDKLRLETAVYHLMMSLNEAKSSQVLWSMYYWQARDDSNEDSAHGTNIHLFPSPCLDLIFDDTVLGEVHRVWSTVLGPEASEEDYLVFDDREGENDEARDD